MIQIDLTGQVAVVTGGSSGIGLATAELFLNAGASVAICGRDGERLARAEAALNGKFPHAPLLAARCNVLEDGDVAAFAQAVSDRFGRADMLINNAGQGRVSTFADTTDDAWRDELELKYFSIIRPTRNRNDMATPPWNLLPNAMFRFPGEYPYQGNLRR